MGNESSSELRHDNKSKRGESGLVRSNSFNLNSNSSNKSEKSPPKSNSKDDKKSTILKRSNTFTPTSSYSKPGRHGNYKRHEHNENLIAHTVTTQSDNIQSDYNKMDVVEKVIKSSSVETEATFADEELKEEVIEYDSLTKKISDEYKLTTQSTSSEVTSLNSYTSTGYQLTPTLEESDQEVKNDHFSVISQEEETRVRSNSLDPYKKSLPSRRKKSNKVEYNKIASDSETMLLNQDKDVLSQTLFSSQSIDEIKRITTAERRKKNVMRSQSMHTHKPRKLSLDCRINSADDPDLDEIPCPTTNAEEKNNSKFQRGIGGRRISDSYLLKEQHIKRSEQFSVMLKQMQSRRASPATKQLSSYGLGVISEKEEGKERRKFQLIRHNEYLDFWLKDQSERIDTLSAAVKGDEDKVRKLRASFRERPLKSPQKNLLPRRPNSVKLPRRKNNSHYNILSSSESETDDSLVTILRSQSKKLDENGNEVKPTIKNPLKKQLSDTILNIDESFKNLTYEHPRKESIKFSKPTSYTGANNVAVVKPMVFAKAKPASETESKVVDSTITVNSVIRANYHVLPEKLIYSDPVDMNNDKMKILEEEKESVDHVLKAQKANNNYKFIQKQISVDEELETKATKTDTTKTQKKEANKSETDNRDVSFEKQNMQSSLMSTSVTSMTVTEDTEATNSSVNRISKSLSKVMGDLKELRQHDINLAKQLLGLGKTIKGFKKSTAIRKQLSMDDEGDV